MSNKTINLTHVNQIGWMRPKIEYIRIKKIVETKKKKTTVEEEKIRYYTDPSQTLSPEQLKQRSDYNQSQREYWINSKKSHVDHRVQAGVVKNYLNSIGEDQHHMLITWTYPKIFGKNMRKFSKIFLP